MRGQGARPGLAGHVQAGMEPMLEQGPGTSGEAGRTSCVPPLMGSQKAETGHCAFGPGVPRTGRSLRKNTLLPRIM